MSGIDLSRDGEVFVLRMQRGENRFNPDFLAAVNAALDEVEATRGPAALVTTGEGKFYSNGLDLDWLTQQDQGTTQAFLRDVLALFARLLGLPMATAAAANGHVFAGGAMLALAHDWRVMRRDRGFFCLPELDLGMPLPLGMRSLIKEKLVPAVFRDAVLTAGRFPAADCERLQIVDACADEADVLSAAIERVRPLAGRSRDAYRMLKRGMYAETLRDLTSADCLTYPP